MRLGVLLLGIMLATPSWATANLTGTWQLDAKASDSLDELLKAQGISWAERMVMRGLTSVTHYIVQGEDQVTVDIVSSMHHSTEVLWPDGRVEERETPRTGRVQVTTAWSSDGSALITDTRLHTADGDPALFRLTRSLQDDGATLVQTLELTVEGKPTLLAHRILRRQSREVTLVR